MFFDAAKDEEEHGSAIVLLPAIRVTQALRKQLGVSCVTWFIFRHTITWIFSYVTLFKRLSMAIHLLHKLGSKRKLYS
jgi:hypothetical protein